MASSRITPDFFLSASGGVTLPQLDIAIFEEKYEEANSQAEKIVAELPLAGYFRFDLICNHEDGHVILQSYKVTQPKPVVTRLIGGA